MPTTITRSAMDMILASVDTDPDIVPKNIIAMIHTETARNPLTSAEFRRWNSDNKRMARTLMNGALTERARIALVRARDILITRHYAATRRPLRSTYTIG